MSTLNDTLVIGRVTQTQPAIDPNHLIRLGEAMTLLNTLFQGAWSSAQNYTTSQMTTDGGSLYIAIQPSFNKQPSTNLSYWRKAVNAGADGASAYTYIGYASDLMGTGFSLTPGTGLNYLAVLATTAPIVSPQASDFAGLWKLIKGADGDDGVNGASSYTYIAFASDSSGANFSLTPTSLTVYMAVKSTSAPITSPGPSDFVGLWVKIRGTDGVGTPGTNGASAYAYIAYASDNIGTGFSLSPADGLNYIAIKATTSPIVSPAAPDFVGLWKNYKGADGASVTGATGAAGAASYSYIAYASDTSGTGFSLSPGSGLNFVAFKTTTSPIASPAAGDFAGLWKNYAGSSFTIGSGSPLTFSASVLDINASSANTPNYVVKRDGNGDFAMRKLTLSTGSATDHITLGSATMGFNVDAVYFSQPIGTSMVKLSTTHQLKTSGGNVQFFCVGTSLNAWETVDDTLVVAKLKLNAVSAGSVLKVNGSNIVASATTSDLPEGSNLYFTNARADARIAALSNVANGICPLDSGAKVPLANLPSSIQPITNTDSLTEGTSNLYYTNARADARITLQRGANSGIAPLDSGAKVPLANLPSLGTTAFGASSNSGMTALTSAKQGDICLRSDSSVIFILTNNTPTVLSNWTQFLYPVASVNGATGTITLTTNNISEPVSGAVNLWFTNARADARITAQRGAASGICPLDGSSLVPVVNLPPMGNSIWVTTNANLTSLTSALKGDLANITDLNVVKILSNNTPTSSGSWVTLLAPVASVNGLTGTVVLATGNITSETGGNLWFTNARGIAATLTGFTASAGTVTASDTVLSALQKHDAAISTVVSLAGGTMTGALRFSGSANPGLIVNQLSATQIGSLSTSSGNNGNLVYDTTNQQLKALVNGSYVIISAGASLPLTAGSGSVLTGTLYLLDSLSTFLQLGNDWSQRQSNTNANYDFRKNGTTVLTLDSNNSYVTSGSGWSFNSAVGYRLSTNQFLYLNGGVNAIDFGGNFFIYTQGGHTELDLIYNGGVALKVDTNADVWISNNLNAANGMKVGGNQVVGARITGWNDPTGGSSRATYDASTVTTSALAQFVAQMYQDLKTHGLIGN